MRATISAYLPILSLFVLAAMFSSCDSGVTDSTDILSAKIGPANVEAAADTFDVDDNIYSPTTGSVTVTYLGEQVTTNFTSTWSVTTLAVNIAQDINTDPDIQLYATVPDYSEGLVRVRERRTGAEYNGNPVYINDNNQYAHLKVIEQVVYLQGGED